MADSNGNGNGNGNGVKSALLLFVTVVLPLGGAMASLYVILDQKIDSSRSERGVILDGMRADIHDHDERLDFIDQNQAKLGRDLSEKETQFWGRAALSHREHNQTRMELELPPLDWIGAGTKENQ